MEDQSDILAANERLTAELAASAESLATARADVAKLADDVKAAQADRDQALVNVAELKEANAELMQQNAALRDERDKLAAADRDFNKRLAAALAKHGVRAEGVAVAGDDPAKKLSLTEQCRAARGT